MIYLGNDCQIRELNIASNAIRTDETTPFVQFLEGKSTRNEPRKGAAMPKLDRIDLSNNNLSISPSTTLAPAGPAPS